MSFSKAPIRRFNEIEIDSPGPNEYDPKDISEKGAGVTFALKENRFSYKTEATPGPGQYNIDEKKKVPKNLHAISKRRVPVRPPRSLDADQLMLPEIDNTSLKVESSTQVEMASFVRPHSLYLQNIEKDRKIEQLKEKLQHYSDFDFKLKSLENTNNAVTTGLNTRIEELAEKNQEIEQLTEKLQQCLDFNSKVKSLENKNNAMITDLKIKTEELAVKDVEIKRLQKQGQELQDKRKKCADLESRIESMERNNTTVALELSTKVDKLVEKDHKIKELTEQLQQYLDLVSKAKSLEDNNNAMTAALNKKTEELSAKDEEIQRLQELEPELRAQQIKCAVFETKLKSMERDNTSLTLEISTKVSENTKHFESILASKDKEIEELLRQKQHYIDLESTRHDLENKNISMKAELLTKEQKLIRLAEEMGELSLELQSVKSDNNSMQLKLSTKMEECAAINDEFKQFKELCTIHCKDFESKLRSMEDRIRHLEWMLGTLKHEKYLLERQLNVKLAEIAERDDQTKELEEQREQIVNLKSTLMSVQNEKNTSNTELVKKSKSTIEQLECKILKLEEELKDEKKKNENLLSLIEPFQDQLESFEAEKCALLARNKEAQGEVKKLAAQYGQLLGHQNHKQKIHYLVKLKEENAELKADNSRLRYDVDKYKKLAMKSVSSLTHTENTSATPLMQNRSRRRSKSASCLEITDKYSNGARN